MNKKIDTCKCQGYLWLSDQKKPLIIHNDKQIEIEFSDGEATVHYEGFSLQPGQFIAEGLLYDSDNLMSYSIKFVDGKYIVTDTKVDSLDYNRENVRIVNYRGNQMPYYLQFLQYWKPEPDCFCEEMETLVPEKLVFVGFINDKED